MSATWDYKIVKEPGRSAAYEWADKMLVEMDALGWELVSVTHSGMLGDTFYFRRAPFKPLYTFQSSERREIIGRGTVFVVPSPEELREGQSLAHLLGPVSINGAHYEVREVDCAFKSGCVRPGDPIGLLIKAARP